MRVGLLADIHANLAALRVVLAALGTVDELWVMGDTVGYGPQPAETLALLRERGAHLVAGNHDRAVATGEGLELFNPIAERAAEMQQGWLEAADREYLGALPITAERSDFTLCHGSLRQPLWEYVVDAAAANATIALAATRHCCNGHTHVPALFRDGRPAVVPRAGTTHPLDARVLVNPGSVGQPRDGDPRASYAWIDTDAQKVTFERLDYDVPETQRLIRARALPELLALRLGEGV